MTGIKRRPSKLRRQDSRDAGLLLVTGMHRSGTSLTMQALVAMGVSAGPDLLAGDGFNARGYMESLEVIGIHNRLLAAFDRPWGSFRHMFPLPADWQSSEAAVTARIEIARYLEQRSAEPIRPKEISASHSGPDKLIAIKDPRMALFLPLWQLCAAAVGLPLSTIICVRSASDVARSLLRRDNLPHAISEQLWLLYNASAIRDLPADGTSMLSFMADWTSDQAEATDRLARFLNITQVPAIGEPARYSDVEKESLRPFRDTAIFDPDLLTANMPDARPRDDAEVPSAPLCTQWYASMERCRATGRFVKPVANDLNEMATSFFAHAQMFEIWPKYLTDSKLQADASFLLSRDIETYRTAHDTLATASRDTIARIQKQRDLFELQAREAHAAVQTTKDQLANALAELARLQAERDALLVQADGNLLAYQTVDQRLANALGDLARLEAERNALKLQAESNLVAYQTVDQRLTDTLGDLAQLESERDALKLQAEGNLVAYQTVDQWLAGTLGDLARLESERDALKLQAEGNLVAYQTVDQRLVNALGDLARMETERDVLKLQAESNLIAYQTVDQRLADATSDLARLKADISRLRRWHLPSRFGIKRS